MSRTFRSRRSVPHGYVVRDGGTIYIKAAPQEFLSPWDVPNYRRSIFSCESKPARAQYGRWYRNRERPLMRNGRWDDIPPRRRTSGWLTW